MRFSRDRRGQSVVIGTVILFGFLILALSLYQVQVVPQQNGQTEFEHFEEVQNDLVELRNAISSAGQSERPQFIDVKLGTNYQTRLFAINPPDPAGTLQTSQSYNITIDDGTNDPVNISTKFVRYRPGYNELQVGSIWYDNSVLYLDERDSGSRAVIIEDQNLVVDNGSLQITALQNNFRASGTRRVSVELYPADTAANISQLSGPVNVSIPTRLSADDGYWNESIENTSSVTYLEVDDDGYNSSEVSALRLRVNSPDNVSVNSVGIQAEPSEGAVRDNVGPAGGGGTGDNGAGGGGDTLPSGAVAYDDADGDGQYDGAEDAYTADEIGDQNLNNVDLVIARDATTDEIQQQNLDSLVIEEGVTLETTGNKLRFTVKTGSIDVSGATLIEGGSGKLELKIGNGNGNINIEDSRLESDGNIKAEGSGGGTNSLLANDNGGDESDGGTYVVDSSNNAAELSVNNIDTSSATLEKGTIV